MSRKGVRNASHPGRSPYATLIYAFLAWKLLLLLMAVSSPGVGYDTSTDLLFEHATNSEVSTNTLHGVVQQAPRIRYAAMKFVRWDAIYFVSVGQRGHVYEQEWAWGWGFVKLIGIISRCMQ